MGLRDYLQIITKRWRIVAGCLLLCLAAGLAATLAIPATYQAKTQLFVSARGSDAEQVYQGGTFSQKRVKSYAEAATSPKVTKPVIDQLGLDLTPRQLEERISAKAPTNTVLIDLAVSDRSPRRAARIANAVGDQFADVIEKIETPAGSKHSPIKVSVTRQASAPTSPESPRPLVNVGLGLVIGLAVGLGLAILLETLDTTVKTAAGLGEVTGLPVLGTILHDPAAAAAAVGRRDPHSSWMEGFRQLRTNLQFAEVDHAPGVLVVTSALNGEGKTAVAENLAVTQAQVGTRVCVVDGDLRRPAIADALGLVGEVGLTNVLIGQASVEDAVQTTGSGFDVLASGPIPPNPSELLASDRMRETLQELRGRYDTVVIDSPPLLPVTDGAVLGEVADGTIVVARAGRTTKAQVLRAVEALRSVGARILGGVLNGLSVSKSDARAYGYGYTYRPQGTHRRNVGVSRSDRPENAPTARLSAVFDDQSGE